MSKPIWTHRILVAILSVALLAPGPMFAQDTSDEVFSLSLDDALRIALENNLSLVSAYRDPEIAEQDVIVADATYDVGMEASGNRSETRRPVTTDQTQFTSSSDTDASFNFAGQLQYGGSYTAGFRTQFTEQSGGILATSSFWASGISLNYEMPLLQGFGVEVTTEQLILARSGVQISELELSASAQQTMETVEGAYWDVLAASAALRIARLSLKRAEDLLELNRKKVEVGTLAPIEITQAEAGVASQEEGVIVAEVTLQDAEDELRRLLAIPQSDPRWEMPIAILDRPNFEPREVGLDESLETALARRPEMAVARQRLRDSELSERNARRNVRHRLDFRGGITPSGISQDEFDRPIVDPGDPPDIPPIFGPEIQTAEADFGDSISGMVAADNYTWNAGLVYTVPFGNRAQKAQAARARLTREKTELALDDQEQTIRVEVRRAVRAVDSGTKRVNAARVNVELQEKKLEAEQKKFENGMSTSFEVLTFQNDLADAELAEIRARLDYIKSLAALERSKGTLLEARGMSLD